MEGNGITNTGIAINTRKRNRLSINRPPIRGKTNRNRFDQHNGTLVLASYLRPTCNPNYHPFPFFLSPQQSISKKNTYLVASRMHKTKAELIELISDIKTKKEIEKDIQTRYKNYQELVDKDTIAFLLVDELGRNKQSITKIVDLTPNGDYTVVGKVVSISDSKTFKRKNGSAGKVINIEITDETATCRLVLWNGDTEYIKNKEIQQGTCLKVINGYTKPGYTGGVEINLGRWGLLEVEPVDASTQKQQQNKGQDITGVLIKKEATKAFFKDDGEIGFITTITVKEQNIEKHIILKDHHVKQIQAYKIRDGIILKNVLKKWENGKTEFHLNTQGSIEKRK